MALSEFANEKCKSVRWNLSDGRNAHEHSTFINLIQHFKVNILFEALLEKCLIHETSTGYRLRSICLFKFHPTDSSLKIDGTLVSL